MYKYLILISCFFLVTASKCSDKKGNSYCTEMGTLKDFTGLDGCNFLIVLDNGDKLQPIIQDADIELKDGQRIKFGYTEIVDQMSICMAGKMVEILCIEFIGSPPPPTGKPGKTGGIKPIKIPCVKTMDPYSMDWMQETMDKTNAYQVVRYSYRTDGWAYYFLGPTLSKMYDCQGTLICECGSRESKCDDKAKNLTDELVIWERD